MSEKNESLKIDTEFTPVEYDPQYILMVNNLKKYFPLKVDYYLVQQVM